MPAPAPETGDPGGMFLIQGKLSVLRIVRLDLGWIYFSMLLTNNA